MKTILLTAAATVALSVPALAGNIEPAPVEPAPVPVTVVPAAPAYEWSGPYLGIQGNYADVETDGGADLDDDGGLIGLRAGYDFDLGSTVAGAFVQYDAGEIELENSGVELEDVLRVGARFGLDSGRNLYYATAGYARAGTDDVGDADGYFAGLGYEVFLTERVTLGAEALYHEFDDFDDTGALGLADTDGQATTVGLNLNFRF